MAVLRYAGDRIVCLSTDVKPTNIKDGAILFESDTLKIFQLISGSWVWMNQFGDGTNYSEFEADGTFHMVGNATVFDDKQSSLISNQLLNPSAHITRNDSEASLTFKTTCDLGDYVYMIPQMPHKWKLGSDIYPHLHWFQTTAAQPNWLIQYRWQRNGQAKTTSWTNLPMTTNAFTWTIGTLGQITYGAGITPPVDYSISDIVQFRVLRDVANTSGAFAGAESSSVDAEATSFDFHYEIDTLGSREEYVK